jgi:hypothetical protein
VLFWIKPSNYRFLSTTKMRAKIHLNTLKPNYCYKKYIYLAYSERCFWNNLHYVSSRSKEMKENDLSILIWYSKLLFKRVLGPPPPTHTHKNFLFIKGKNLSLNQIWTNITTKWLFRQMTMSLNLIEKTNWHDRCQKRKEY